MADPHYKDPKVTTPKSEKGGIGKILMIIVGVLVALLLLAWLLGLFADDADTTDAVATEPAATEPAADTVPAE